MKLELKRPLAFIDIETTGLDIIKDRIVEISIAKLFPDGHTETYTRRVNPTIPISEKATKITGITDEDVKDLPIFKDIAQELSHWIENCDIAGYNSTNFDIPMLAEEFVRAEIDFDFKKTKFIDVQVIFHKKEQRTLSAAYKFYCEKDLENAHSAEADVLATLEVLEQQLNRYEDLEPNIEFLSKYSVHNRNVDFVGRIILNDNDEPIFNFGKYKGQKVTDVFEKDKGYYSWMMNAEFPYYTKYVLTKIKLSMTKNVK